MKLYLSSDAANSRDEEDESVVFCPCDCLCAVMTWKPVLKEQRSAELTASPSWTSGFVNTGQGNCTSWCLSFTMCEIWIMIYFFSCERHGDGVFAQTWHKAHGYPCGFHDTSDWSQCKSLKGQFSIKENWWIRCCPSYKRICFSLPISWFYHSCLGRFWEPLVSLAPASFAVHLPSQWEARSWEHWVPSCLFISCRGKAEVDSWCYKTLRLWCRSAGCLQQWGTLIRDCLISAFPFHIPTLEVSKL